MKMDLLTERIVFTKVYLILPTYFKTLNTQDVLTIVHMNKMSSKNVYKFQKF